MLQLFMVLFGIISLFLAVNAYRSAKGAGTRLGTQRFLAALFWGLFGMGLVLNPLTWFSYLFLGLAAPAALGWAAANSANKDRALPGR